MLARSESTDEAVHLSLGDLLFRISRELDENAILANDCQMIISEIVPTNLSASLIKRLQAVDLLSQTLVELASLLNRTGAVCPADPILPGNFLVDVRLAALRDRLAGKVLESAGGHDPEIW